MADVNLTLSSDFKKYALNAAMLGEAQISTWYACPFGSASFIPSATDTAATVVGDSEEFAAAFYEGGTRKLWVPDDDPALGDDVANLNTLIYFTALQAMTVWGVSIHSTQPAQSLTGILVGSGRILSPGKVLAIGDEVKLTVTMSAGDMNA